MSNLDHKFKEALEGYTELPSPELWDKISAAVDEHNDQNGSGELTEEPVAAPKKKALVVVWRKQFLAIASAAATIALLWTLIWEPTPEYNHRAPFNGAPTETDLSSTGTIWSPIEETLKKPATATEPSNATGNATEVAAVTTPAKSPLAPRWEERLEEHELELALEDDLMELEIVRSEFIQSPVKVIVEFELEEANYYARKEETGKISKIVGEGAKNFGQNMAKIIGKGYLNWESAKVSVNHTLASISTRKTPKNK